MAEQGRDVRGRFKRAYGAAREAVRRCDVGGSYAELVVLAYGEPALIDVRVERDELFGIATVMRLEGEMGEAVRPGLARLVDEEWWGPGYSYLQFVREYVPAEDGLGRWMRGV